MVAPIVDSGARAYVIISDALRYEVAAELCEHMLKNTRGNAKISSMQSIFPSVTKFGMAALLPHLRLQMTDDGKVLCDGESTEGTAAREKILKNIKNGSYVITLEIKGKKTDIILQISFHQNCVAIQPVDIISISFVIYFHSCFIITC